MDAIAEAKSWRFLVLAAITAGVVVGLWLWIPRFFSTDVYAPVNALFSGLAFAGLIIAIFLQREELQLQRRELALTREEMQGQKQQLEGQKQQMEIQNFENRFFQMMAIWRELKRDVDDGPTFHGLMIHIQDKVIETQSADGFDPTDTDDKSAIHAAVKVFYENHPIRVKDYMRALCSLLTIVDGADVGAGKQRFYTDIVNMQLSQHELVVVFYSGLADGGLPELKPLIEKYGLFRNMLVGCEHGLAATTHPSLYAPSAFE